MIRSLIARGMAALALLSLAFCSVEPVLAQTASSITVKDGTGTSQTLGTGTAGSKQFYGFYGADASGNPFPVASQTLQQSMITALGSPYQAGGALPLPSGAATSAAQATGNASLGTLAGTVGPTGTPQSNAQTIQATALPLPTGAAADATLQAIKTLLGAAPAQVGGKIDTVISGTGTDISASVPAATATTLAAANPSRRGFSIQNQTTGNCYLNGVTAPTGGYHDLLIAAGAYYESKDSHVGIGTLQIYCANAGGVYGRQW